MSELIVESNHGISEQLHHLGGLAWNLVLLLFAAIWLAAAGFTSYSLFSNVSEISLFWQFLSLVLLVTWFAIAGTGAVVAVIGIFSYANALFSRTTATSEVS